ncbi:efflux RND transporter permease subunit [Salirhabdus salicampi]|uniref:efflux RND transporter permease subunit n=1 Tax=Salirhabdus salicampi TaxID=476102 RepID=UPI0020C3C414|nr:efflux RND transporter permease subunit [Salirhabdus salicampi]
MKLIHSSVRRPVGVTMIVLALVALGFVSLRNLTIDLYPDINFPIAVVSTSYEGAAPQEVERLISRPIESGVSSIEGIKTVQTRSQPGASLVVLMFETGANLDSVLLDVREKVDQVKGMLPEDAGTPNVLRFDPQQIPVMWVGLNGADDAELQSYAENQLVPHFERQEGVASVTIEGGSEQEVQVLLQQDRLYQYGLSAGQLVQALHSANQSASAGVIEKGDQNLQIRIKGEYESIDDIKQTIVQSPQGALLQLKDIADVKEVAKEKSTISLVNGSPSVVMSILKKTDGNTVKVADEMYAAIDELQERLPEELSLNIVFDTSTFIRMSIESVVKNIGIGALFATVILLLFLKSVRATLVIGISIPIAIISTFTLMYFTGETINVLTMGGLALGIGMMVDSSIVILENIVTYRQRGYSVMEAAKHGASELAPAVIAATTTTLIVFLPIVFVEGIASELFTPLALTISFALFASLLVSITLIPMLASKLLPKQITEEGRRLSRFNVMGKVKGIYISLLKTVLKFRKTTILTTVLAIGGSFSLVPTIGTEFIPPSDQGQIEIRVTAKPGTNLESTKQITEQIDDKLSKYEDQIETVYLSVGGGGFESFSTRSHRATYTIQLVGKEERTLSTMDMIKMIDEDLQMIPGIEAQVRELSSSLGSGEPVHIQLTGPDYDVLQQLGDQVVTVISDVDGIHEPETSTSEGIPEIDIMVDRQIASQYGLSYDQVLNQVRISMNGQLATRYRTGGDELDVRLILPKENRRTIADVETMPIQTPSGAVIPLSTVATFDQVEGPVTLMRENRQRQLNVTSDIVDRDLGSIMDDVDMKLQSLHFPEGYSYKIGGQAEDMMDSFRKLGMALIFSIFLVYAVMAIQFENFLHPFIIMFSLPATVVGVILGLVVTQKPLSVPAFVGVIMLAGIVVNNAIVLVDYINLLRQRGVERYEAILQAAPSRLRPILMTTITTVLGMIPLSLGLGEGAEAQQPLAIVIIFGLSISMMFTLLLIPVVYTYLDDLARKMATNARQNG